MQDKMFVSPDKYLQGAGLLERSAQYISPFGNKILLISDDIVWEIAGDKFAKYLSNEGFTVKLATFNGESSANEVDRITEIGQSNKSEIIIGLGGGKTLDTAKGVSENLEGTLIIAPTAASADAPTAGLSVIYTDDGVFDHYAYYKQHSDLVLMDTQVVAGAPVRTLISGIADAFATNIEAKATEKGFGATFNGRGGVPTQAGLAIASKCEEILWKYAYEAVISNQNKIVTPELDKVVEANTLLSGLGFENGGLAAAHSIQDGFTAISGEVHKLTHGEKVAFGTLVQLVLQETPHEELEKYLEFYTTLGLPVTLEQMHLDKITDEEFTKIGEKATDPNETMSNMPFTVTSDMVINGMKAASAIAHQFIQTHDIKPLFHNPVLGKISGPSIKD